MSLALFAELKRRRVFRALVGYGIAAFAVLQIVEPVMHGLRWPDTVLSYVVVALAVGFPIVVTLAWIFDVNQGRVERTGGGPGGARLVLILAGIGALAAAPGLLWYFVWRTDRGAAARAREPSIAVLPFVNLSSDRENEYFSDGVTEEIINALANVDGVRVVARTSAFSFKGKNVNVRQVGEELNVATVLEGSVRREGNQLRIAAQLIGAADGYHIWSKTFDRELKNVFSLEDELARAIVQSLKPKLVPERALVQQAAVSTEAHDLYLKGRYFWNQRSRESLTKAKASFEQAVALDPKYAVAHSGLADCYTLLIDYGRASSAKTLPKAEAHAREALELDDSLAEGHASLGAVAQHEYDWDTSERELKRAIELRPGYATAHQWYAEILWMKGRLPEALAQAEQARQLDPTSPIVNLIVAVTYLYGRDYDRAIEQATKTLELDPAFPSTRAYLAMAYLQTGKLAEAMATLDAEPGKLQGMRAQVLAARGELAAAKRLLSETEARLGPDPGPRLGLAAAHLAVGDKEGAFTWLERGVEEQDPLLPAGVKWGPNWDPVRSERRFQKLLRRMNLE
ncbi:MAG: tetratricopeptide repeat protein [Deltaproteobacteria bacterium]|nr:MAG: tetratricopeptide repeat protein [Deltaproteobacteria bacterium]